MKKTIQTIAMAALCLFLSPGAYTQTVTLKLGETVPETFWTLPLEVVNHPDQKESIRLEDFKGKLIILDFWATWCGSCISGFEKMHALKQQFRENVEIIAVTAEPAEKAEKFLKTNPKVKALNLFSVTGKNRLHEYFPYGVLPHYVWISPDGKLIAASSDQQITAFNLSKVLDGQKIQFAMREFLKRDQPVFLNGVPNDAQLKKYAVLIQGKVDGLPSVRTLRKSDGKVTGACYSNLSLMSIYRGIAMDLIKGLKGKQLISEVDPSDKLQVGAKMKAADYYTFDYEDPDYSIERLLEQINFSSGYYGRVEKRTVDCLLLVRTIEADLIKTKGGQQRARLFHKSESTFRNGPVSLLVSRLNDPDVAGPLVIDQTLYTDPIDMDINAGAGDLPGIVRELNKYGLDLVKSQREIEQFIISPQTVNNNSDTHIKTSHK